MIMNEKCSNHSKMIDAFNNESDNSENHRRSRKSRHHSIENTSSSKRLKLEKKSKKSKKHKSSKSKHRHSDKSPTSKHRKSGYKNNICLESSSIKMIDTYKRKTGIMSELRKINHPHNTEFLKPKIENIIENGIINGSLDSPSVATKQETDLKTITSTICDEINQDLNFMYPFTLDDINLPPEPIKSKEPTLELKQNYTPIIPILEETSQCETQVKDIQISSNAEECIKNTVQEKDQHCKLSTIPNNLPLPKMNSPVNCENHIRKEKVKTHRSPLPLPYISHRYSSSSIPNSAIQTKDDQIDRSLNKVSVSSELVTIKIPSICERRSKSRNNKTWGERSASSFKFLDKVGEGTYGHVFKASDIQTGELKALKKVRLENEKEGFPITAIREIKILRQLCHANIVNLCEIVTDMDTAADFKKDKGSFYLVFDYMDHDLFGILEAKSVISEDQVASIFKQLLEGIHYCHSKDFLHRDIKCSNILVNNKGEIKLADFGLARLYIADDKQRPYTNKVITLWYRSPELLLGEECYGTSIDIWSLGCILGELFTGQTMFTASEEMEQLESISRICGVPTPSDWPKVARLPHFEAYKPRHNYRRRLREYYCTLPHKALDLLDWMLKMDPEKRCSAQQALRCDWLRSIDPRKIRPPDFPRDRDCHELSSKKRRKLMRQEKELKAHKMGVDLPSTKQHHSSSASRVEEVKRHQEPSSKAAEDGDLGSALSRLAPEAADLIKTILEQLPRGTTLDTGSLHEMLLPLVGQLASRDPTAATRNHNSEGKCPENP